MIAELPGILSHSQMKNLQECGGRYWLERVVKAPQRPGWGAIGGSAVHQATEWWDYQLLDTGEVNQDPEFLKLLFETALDNEITERLAHSGVPIEEWKPNGRVSKAWPDKENEAYWRSEGWKQVHAWTAWRLNSGWEVAQIPNEDGDRLVWAIEVRILAEIAGEPVLMFIDRVMAKGNDLMIVDLKSGTYTPDENKQLVRYRYGLEQKRGVRAKWGCYWMGRKGSNTTPIDLDRWTDRQIEYDIHATRAQQLSGVFTYHPTRLCPSCSVNRYCPEYGGDLAHTVPQPWEQTGAPIILPVSPGVMMVEPSADDEEPE